MKKQKPLPIAQKISPSLKPKSIRTHAKPIVQPAVHRSECPVNLVLEMIGDSWSMLIIRDIMLRNHTGYQAFLTSGEKIATNILADRLVKLETNGLLSKAPDPKDARKFIYALTEKGALLAPLLIEMVLYSAQIEDYVDIAKDQLVAMQRNKAQFSKDLIKRFAPKSRNPKSSKPARQEADETLSLF